MASRNLIVRLGVDASDFQKKMQQAGASAASAGKRIRKELNMSDLGAQVSEIMGWSGQTTGVGEINAQNVGLAQNQLGILKSYRDQLAGAGFDDYQFGLVSERIKALEYDIDAYTQSLKEAADAEREVAQEASDMGQSSEAAEKSVSRASRSFEDMERSGRRLNLIPGSIQRIGDSADSNSMRLQKMVRTIRNVSVVSFGLRIARSLFGEFSTIIRNHISQDAALQAQVNGLSAALGQSLAPAVTLVANALSYVLPYVVGFANAVSSLMGLLFGSGWDAATAGANKTAAATGSAAKAQKELNRQLLSFDQINKLDSQSDTGSAGGGGGTGTGALAAIEAKVPAWLERFKQSFSDLFNSSEFQAANVGGKIGMILQTGLDWLGSEGINFDWRGVGTKLRENFNSFMNSGWVSTFFYDIGVGIGGLSEFVSGLLGEGIDWGNVYERFTSTVLTPLTAGLADFFREKGNESAASFWEGIEQWVSGKASTAVGGLALLPIMPIIEARKDFKDQMNETGRYSMEGFGEGMSHEITASDWKQFFIDFIAGVKRILGINSPSTVFADIGQNCMKGMENGLGTGTTGVLQKLSDLYNRVLDIARRLKEAFSFEWSLPHLRLPHLSVEWDPVDNVLAQFFGVTAFPRLSVSWFAKGGILDGAQIFGRMGNTLLGGGELGREAILPLDTNTGWMDVLANRIAQSLDVGGGNGGNVTVNVLLDGDLITTYVLKGMRQKTRAGTASV